MFEVGWEVHPRQVERAHMGQRHFEDEHPERSEQPEVSDFVRDIVHGHGEEDCGDRVESAEAVEGQEHTQEHRVPHEELR